MKYCDYCHKEIPDEALFCPHCGRQDTCAGSLIGRAERGDQEAVSRGELSPVFFGSALTNFGVETFLRHFLQMTAPPVPRMSDAGMIQAQDPVF